MKTLFLRLTRKKQFSGENLERTQLSRCLNTWDLTALGVGSTLGAGIYVVAGQVAKMHSGPSVFLSFLVAAVASILAGICYAEFGARVPKTGSAYVYSYVTVGELMAFVIGWNLILEYAIGASSVARAWSLYFDSLINNKIQHAFRDSMPMNIEGLSPYPDFFSFGITVLLTVILAVGVKESSRFNNIFTGVNLLVVTFIIVCGSFKADSKNWVINPDEVSLANVTSSVVGEGGFLPFGFSGMLTGSATCFYAFIGFDVIATTGEEVKNPQKAIPVSIVVSLLICCLAYSGISVVITLMCPYYLLDHDAPLPAVFHRVGWDIAKYIIAVGAVCGLSTSLLGAMFPLPRVIYAIASDGLIFRFLAKVSERFKTPFLATILSGTFAGFMAMMFDLTELVEMMSIGTLLAYTLVAVSVLLLRYKVDSVCKTDSNETQTKTRIIEGYSREEVKNPQKAIPVSIVVSLLICCLAYSGISVVITLMCPYYLLDHDAPLPAVFHRVGWDIAKYIIAVGAVCGLSTSLLGAMFPLPRVIYAIASDGLIFRFLAKVSERFKTPFLATILSGTFAGFMAMMFDLTELVEMMSIGTLLAYTLVAVSVLLLRYKVDSVCKTDSNETQTENSRELDTIRDEHIQTGPDRSTLFLLFGCSNRNPSTATEHLASFIIVVYCVIGFLFGLFLKLSEDTLNEGNLLYVLIAVLFVILMSVLLVSLGCQPQNQAKLNFKVPWVPVLPGISISINTILMIRLPVPTWYRFAIWMTIGFVIYFCYGMFHSSEEKRIKNRCVENQAEIGISGPLTHGQTDNEHEVGECTPLLK